MHSNERATFDAAELAVVLSHYDLGVIESVTDFARGSRRSPKAGLVTERGKYVLKRRTMDRTRVERARFSHNVQRHLLRQGFPIAKVVGTRNGGSFLPLHEFLYEAFEFVPGHPFEGTTEETSDAGRRLAQFHQATANYVVPPDVHRPHGDYHNAQGVRAGLGAIGSTLRSHDSFAGNEAELIGLTVFLLDWYERAVEAVTLSMTGDDGEQVIHGDWHPGNLLFRDGKVLAVIDLDSVRFSRRVIDLANGLLHFSILAGGDPANWPERIDEDRFNAFAEGYRSEGSLSRGDVVCIPHLMGEALIAECVGPIATTGSVGRWSGFRMLQMVRRKLQWIESNAARLTARLYGPSEPP